MMRSMVRVKKTAARVAAILLLLLTLGMIAWVARPLYLDHIYYRGSVSNHFDGQRFFNPEGEQGTGGDRNGPGLGRIFALITGDRGPGWPNSVPVASTIPPERIAGSAMRVTWIGHSTVLVQTQGLNILTDPVWVDKVGPLGLVGASRVRPPGVRLADLPKIDLILISHNHYDHMDVATLRTLWNRDRPLIVTSLGNDAILKDHGIAAQARDWGGRVGVRPGITVIIERAHHWSSRWGEDRNRALWSGFTVTLPGGNIFYAGDTGQGDGSWIRSAAKDGPFRLALLPIGAFHPRKVFSGNHIDPQQSVQVFRDIGARHALGVHWGTFKLTEEEMNEPKIELADALKAAKISAGRFITTEVGQGWMVP